MHKKAKVLPPTLREKQRYMVYDANYFGQTIPSYAEMKNSLHQHLISFLGELGFGDAGVLFVKGSGKKGILRVNRDSVDHVKTSLMTVNKINRQDVSMRCIGVSGSIKKAEELLH